MIGLTIAMVIAQTRSDDKPKPSAARERRPAGQQGGATGSISRRGRRHALLGCSPMLKEFRQFIARGNVIDLAVAVIIGAAFGKITTSLVEGILMPPLGLILGRIDFASLFYTLDQSRGAPLSLADAKRKAFR
jgi:hypothetical protein